MRKYLMLLLFMFIPSMVFAFTVVNSGIEFTISGDEPTINNTGSDLTDFNRIECSYSIPPIGMLDEGKVEIAASSPTGGLPFECKVVVSQAIENFEGDVEFHVVACDAALTEGRWSKDNCSPKTTVLHPVDVVAPMGIQ